MSACVCFADEPHEPCKAETHCKHPPTSVTVDIPNRRIVVVTSTDDTILAEAILRATIVDRP